MELIQTIMGNWYWRIDNAVVGYHESTSYTTEEEAIQVGFDGEITWEES